MLTTLKTLEQTVVTNPEHWLGQSTYFEAFFSKRWAGKEGDGSYLIETDGATFEHILRHLRSGRLPVFYNADKGHDFSLYHSLLEGAEYFGIVRLSKWLREKKYLDAVQVHYVAAKTKDPPPGFQQERIVSDQSGGTLLREVDDSVKITAGGHMNVSIVPITQMRNIDVSSSGRGEWR